SGCKIKYGNTMYNSPYTFTGLSMYTDYTFYSIAPSSNTLNESPVSDSLVVKTTRKEILFDGTNSKCILYDRNNWSYPSNPSDSWVENYGTFSTDGGVIRLYYKEGGSIHEQICRQRSININTTGYSIVRVMFDKVTDKGDAYTYINDNIIGSRHSGTTYDIKTNGLSSMNIELKVRFSSSHTPGQGNYGEIKISKVQLIK
ncbi:MAG: hypothetical protein ACRCXT_19275, partial [Paraclostridium sp.]